MIKRPLDPRFTQAVLEGRKFTTIREKPWPVGKPIMLYNWSGAAYRSKQVDVAAVRVTGFWAIRIAQLAGGGMRYAYGMETATPLWQTEGFDSPEALDDWFRSLVKPGHEVTKTLMRFKLFKPAAVQIITGSQPTMNLVAESERRFLMVDLNATAQQPAE